MPKDAERAQAAVKMAIYVHNAAVESAALLAEDTTRAIARGDFGLIGPVGIGMRIAAEIRAKLLKTCWRHIE